MKDVAKKAGVSVTTVGRVIHGNGYVSAENKDLVENAIKGIGYVPNKMARGLKSQRSGIIGSLLTHNQNFLYEKINESIIESAENAGYELITMEARANETDSERLIESFIGMQIEGLVITSNMRISKSAFKRLEDEKIPVVMVERTYKKPYVDNLVVKDFEGSYNAVKRMIDKGHKEIALIAKDSRHDVEKARYRGYIEALSDAGIDIDKSKIKLVDEYEIEQGYKAMKELIEDKKISKITAIFCTADTFVSGAMQVLYEKNLRIPDDISVAGYDNVLSAKLAPQIDSVDLDITKIGENVIKLLKERIENFERPAESIDIDTVYIDRNSVKDINNK